MPHATHKNKNKNMDIIRMGDKSKMDTFKPEKDSRTFVYYNIANV